MMILLLYYIVLYFIIFHYISFYLPVEPKPPSPLFVCSHNSSREFTTSTIIGTNPGAQICSNLS